MRELLCVGKSLLMLSSYLNTELKQSFFLPSDTIAHWLLFSIILIPLYFKDSSYSNQVIYIQLGKSVIPIIFGRVVFFLIAFAYLAIPWKFSRVFVDNWIKIALRLSKLVFLYKVWNFFYIKEQLDRQYMYDLKSTKTMNQIASFKNSYIVFHLDKSLMYWAISLDLFSEGLID